MQRYPGQAGVHWGADQVSRCQNLRNSDLPHDAGRSGAKQGVAAPCAPHTPHLSFPHHHADLHLWAASSGEKGSMSAVWALDTIASSGRRGGSGVWSSVAVRMMW